MYIHIYIYIYIYIHTDINIHCMRAYIEAHKCSQSHIHTHTDNKHILTHMNTHTHSHAHTHAESCIQTQIRTDANLHTTTKTITTRSAALSKTITHKERQPQTVKKQQDTTIHVYKHESITRTRWKEAQGYQAGIRNT